MGVKLGLTLREEHRIKVFENRVLRGIFLPKRDEVKGEWRKLYNEELHNCYSSPSIIGQKTDADGIVGSEWTIGRTDVGFRSGFSWLRIWT
jgi:hypothetical protein